jgi:uncharacterized hydrophobic protein (TIGR00271 family)
MCTPVADHDQHPHDDAPTGAIEYAHLVTADGTLERNERLEILTRLIPSFDRDYSVSFGLTLALSVTIAVMGLATDSVAIVIGAMLVAPLMTPIMGFVGAIGLSLGRRAFRAAMLVLAGSIGSIALAALLSRLLLDLQIGDEIMGRTSPDIRDLVVAVAAGAAGAYATAREDVSASLPGVAVAVALVPPLAVTGLLIETGERTLAWGSMLLFLTNLVAISLSALVVFAATGVVPITTVVRDRTTALTVAGIVLATVMIAIPLWSSSSNAAAESRLRTDVTDSVQIWLAGTDLAIIDLDIDDGETATVNVDIAGLDEPPGPFTLATALAPLLGDTVAVNVRWDQRAQGSASADRPPTADDTDVATGTINDWVTRVAATGTPLALVDVTVNGDDVTAVVSGPTAPPSDPALPDTVAESLGRPVTLAIRWIQTIDPNAPTETPAETMERLVAAWVGPRTSVRVIATDLTGGEQVGWNATVDLAAADTPLGLDGLADLLERNLPGDVTVAVRTLPLEIVDIDGDTFDAPILD